MDDPAFAEAIVDACASDILFWINTLCFTYDPRKVDAGENPNIPWITYSFQDDGLLALQSAIGKEDLLGEKSRDMGFTWMILAAFAHPFQFHSKPHAFLVVSRTEDYVYNPGNHKALFTKLQYLFDWQPSWALPRMVEVKKHFGNLDTNSTIDGEATTKNIARGDRRTAIMVDEFGAFDIDDGFRVLAATQAATRSRIFNSTPAGASGAFFRMAKTNIKKLRAHWSEHPDKNQGLYISEEGKVKVLDKDYKFPSGYKFILDGKLRSPWYDAECERMPIASLIAQELDISYLGSGSQFFKQPILDQHAMMHGMQPLWIGDLNYLSTTCEPLELIEDATGMLSLWIDLGISQKPPADEMFVIGGDVSTGSGSSNSTLSIARMHTGEKVGEVATPYLRPEEFAPLTVALCKFFNDAFLVWEANGPGGEFGAKVIELGYRNIYMRTDEESLTKKPQKVAGWFSNKRPKRILLGDYGHALATNKFINHSREALAEAGCYVIGSDGSIEYSDAQDSLDPSGAGENHGDRVIADALCHLGTKKQQFTKEAEPPQIPENCYLSRRKQWEDAQRNRARY